MVSRDRRSRTGAMNRQVTVRKATIVIRLKTTMKSFLESFLMRAACFAALLTWIGALPSSAAPSLTLIDKGQSEYSIVIPAASDDVAQRNAIDLAASLLQSTLEQAAGVKLPIVAEATLAADAPAIYLGKTLAANGAALPLAEVSGWTTLEAVRGKNVFLV